MQSTLTTRLKLWRASRVGSDVSVIGRIWMRGRGALEIGNRVLFDASEVPIDLYVARGARLVIGDDIVIRGGSSITATSSVEIGAGTELGPYCCIMDTSWHPLHFGAEGRDSRVIAPSAAVVVGDGVKLGTKVIVLSGVTIGTGAVVLDRSVISRNLPAHVTVQGHPPRPVKTEEKLVHDRPDLRRPTVLETKNDDGHLRAL
jgi:acetyltransferase-like isoleucine patch superfamily enzyme